MQRLGIEVGTVRPLHCAKRRVDLDRIEDGQISESTEDLSLQYRPEINPLLGAVVESKRQRVGPDDLEVLHPINGVSHESIPSPQWLDLERQSTGLQATPILQQFGMVNLRPGLDETLLGSGKLPTDALDWIERKCGNGVLIRGVEMRSMMRCADLHEHANDDSEES